MNKQKVSILAIALMVSSLTNCAKEVSEEERQREERDRQLQRIEMAEGVFKGSLNTEKGQTPVELTFTAQKNTGISTKAPKLLVSMNIGLFGGVKIESSDSSYDHGTGEIIANFTSTSAGINKTLELKGYIEGDEFKGSLTGAQQGIHALNLNKNSLSLVTLEKEYHYSMIVNDDKKVTAEVIIERLNKTHNSTPSYDLPELPFLTAGFRFIGLSSSPLVPQDVRYDPLSGTMEIDLTNTSKMTIHNLYLAENGSGSPLSLLTAEYEIGHKKYASAQLSSGSPVLTEKQLTKPPQYFIGKYKGPNSDITFNIIAQMNLTGKVQANPIDSPFGSFPSLNLNMTICLGDVAYKQSYYKAYALDHLMHQIKFQDRIGTLELMFDEDFSSLKGQITSTSSNSDALGSTVQLQKSEIKLDCSFFSGVE